MTSGFILAMPVFFDTVFFLMIPLARGLYQKLGKHYLKYMLAIACCATAHALVPPTPGPLLAASELGVGMGRMMLVGCLVGFPAAIAGIIFAGMADKMMPNLKPPALDSEVQPETSPVPDDQLPSLGLSLLPILLPIIVIAGVNFFHTPPSGGQPDPSVLGAIGTPALSLFLLSPTNDCNVL